MTETPPDPQELKFALGKFGQDAKHWNDTKTEMDKAKQGADALDIETLAFGPANWLGIADKYRQVKQMVSDRCNEGATEFGEIGKALIKARNEYEKDEAKNVHATKKVW
jgi:hypothetical protein